MEKLKCSDLASLLIIYLKIFFFTIGPTLLQPVVHFEYLWPLFSGYQFLLTGKGPIYLGPNFFERQASLKLALGNHTLSPGFRSRFPLFLWSKNFLLLAWALVWWLPAETGCWISRIPDDPVQLVRRNPKEHWAEKRGESHSLRKKRCLLSGRALNCTQTLLKEEDAPNRLAQKTKNITRTVLAFDLCF